MPIAYKEADCGIQPTIKPKRGFRFLSRRFKVGSWSLAALLAMTSQNAVLGQAPCNCGPGSQYPGSAQYHGAPYQGAASYGGGQYGNQGANQYYSQPVYGQTSQYYGQGPHPNQGYIQAPGQYLGQSRATGPMQAPTQAAQQKTEAANQGRANQEQSSASVQSSSDAGPNRNAGATQWSGPASGAVSEGYVGPLPSGGNWQGPSSWSSNQGSAGNHVVDHGPQYGGPVYGGAYSEGIINGGPVCTGPAVGGGYLGGSSYVGAGYTNGNFGQPVACAPVTCAPAPQPLGIYGGFDFLFIRPHFDNNVAFVIDPPSGNTLQTYDYDYEFSPRAYLGWQDQCSGFGLRFGFWNFDADAGPYSATSYAVFEPIFVNVQGASGNLFRAATAEFDAGVSQTLTAQHELELQVYDLEMTQAFCARGWNFLGGVGVRFANIDQLMHAEARRDSDNELLAVVSNDLSVEGVGPTVSLQAFRPLGKSRFSAFGGVRGSLLLADTQQSIYNGYYGNWDNDAGPDGIPGNGDDVVTPDTYATLTDRADQSEVITNFELQLGVQYQLPITSRCDLILRSAYETQTWFDVGGPVDSHSTLSFDGISFMTGLMF